ncbi:hypothetical protein [Flavobacterium sp. RS13.1]|jgi:3-methyladenine DNA glycosylase/8-oxoguanine DNA glycosylase|uniref:hypothetical protein n=1 Tax=Flavobacterium sp. RS13.1 TaxID=3400345 RepID=UPI003AAC8463
MLGLSDEEFKNSGVIHQKTKYIKILAEAVLTKELFNIQGKEEMEIHSQQCSPNRSYAAYLLQHYYLNKRNRKITY